MILRSVLLCSFLWQTMVLSGQGGLKAPEGTAPNTLLAVLGGSGIYTSLIYERALLHSGDFRFGARGGVGMSPFRLTFASEFNIPVGIFLVYGRTKHHPELSLNITNLFDRPYDLESGNTSGHHKALLVPSIAYRYQKPGGGLTFKAGFSPVIYFNKVQTTITPWIELGGGWSF